MYAEDLKYKYYILKASIFCNKVGNFSSYLNLKLIKAINESVFLSHLIIPQ